MKIFKLFFAVFTVAAILLSCQKELNFDANNTSSGTFKKDGSGNCAPVNINGIYKADSVLNASNFVDIQVNVITPGTFDIKSDSINGFSFRKAGSVTAGTNTIRLYATGKPVVAGTSNFTVKYGASTCTFSITVIPANGSGAIFTFGGAPNACTGAVVGGTYVAGTPLAPSNTLTLQVNVSTPGYYAVAAATTNGFLFSGTGVFTVTGLQNVVLTGSGTPVNAGVTSVTVTSLTSSCIFAVNVQPSAGGGTATYTFNGTPNACIGVAVNGIYTVGTATGATNTVVINVNVTTTGGYTITTAAANGLVFAKTGSFTTTGAQTVTLSAAGIPLASGAFNYTATGNGSSGCTFSVTPVANGPVNPFVLGVCSSIAFAGTYTAGTPLTVANTMSVPITVTALGTYNVSTTSANGVVFTAVGTFTTIGNQTLVLTGNGTPTAAGSFNYTITGGGSTTCSPSLTFTAGGGGGTDVFQCKINGVLNTFIVNADGSYAQPGNFEISGLKSSTALGGMYLNIDRTLGGFTTVVPGTYTIAGSTATTYGVDAINADDLASLWSPNQFTLPYDPFTIIITSISATRVVGTFSGTIRDNLGAGTQTKIITEGVFNLPVN